MRDAVMLAPVMRKQQIELSADEHKLLNTIFDLLIPSDHEYPPPSSLHLLEDIVSHLVPDPRQRSSSCLNASHLRSILRNLNTLADGSFCLASIEIQKEILCQLDRQDPAFFQTLWTLTNHSYYTRLAELHHPYSST